MKLGGHQKQQQAQWEPDVERIVNGAPFSTKGLSESEIARITTTIPVPVLAMAADGKRAHWDCPGVKYPSGPWAMRTDLQGNIWWVHAEFSRRSLMPHFKRRVISDDEERQAKARRAFGGGE